MTSDDFSRLSEAARNLNDPEWMKLHAGGDAALATARLAEENGCRGRAGYFAGLCRLVKQFPQYDEFETAFTAIERLAADEAVAALSSAEVQPAPEWTARVEPNNIRFGSCFRRAREYLNKRPLLNCQLIHGTIDGPDGRCEHAWVEIPGDIVFDGVLQRFYAKADYYAIRNARADREYPSAEATRHWFNAGHDGPWSDDDLLEKPDDPDNF